MPRRSRPDTELFVDEALDVMGLFAYVVIGDVNTDADANVSGSWLGVIPDDESLLRKSRAPQAAWCKHGELVWLYHISGPDSSEPDMILTTPDSRSELSLGWKGGIAQNGTSIAVSKLAQEHDLLIAAIALYYAVHNRPHLHHVGFRYPTFEEYEEANAVLGEGFDKTIPDDHHRYYVRARPGKGHYLENQYFPDGPHDYARHWDFVVEDPVHFLRFIAGVFGEEPDLWSDVGEHDPVGMFKVTVGEDDNEVTYAVMARSEWWEITE